MFRLIRAMAFYFDRWREEEKARKEALGDIIANNWRCVEVERMEADQYMRSYRRLDNGAYYRRPKDS